MWMLYWPLAVAMQRLKTIAGQGGQVSQRCGCLKTVELQARGTGKTGVRLDPFPSSEVLGLFVPVADDHWTRIAGSTRYVKRNE
jgi:hypothetical protein